MIADMYHDHFFLFAEGFFFTFGTINVSTDLTIVEFLSLAVKSLPP